MQTIKSNTWEHQQNRAATTALHYDQHWDIRRELIISHHATQCKSRENRPVSIIQLGRNFSWDLPTICNQHTNTCNRQQANIPQHWDRHSPQALTPPWTRSLTPIKGHNNTWKLINAAPQSTNDTTPKHHKKHTTYNHSGQQASKHPTQREQPQRKPTTHTSKPIERNLNFEYWLDVEPRLFFSTSNNSSHAIIHSLISSLQQSFKEYQTHTINLGKGLAIGFYLCSHLWRLRGVIMLETCAEMWTGDGIDWRSVQEERRCGVQKRMSPWWIDGEESWPFLWERQRSVLVKVWCSEMEILDEWMNGPGCGDWRAVPLRCVVEREFGVIFTRNQRMEWWK